MAYCMLEVLGVNMSLLYGEGSQAFVRLQKEIINREDDESFFAWCPRDTGLLTYGGMFTNDPSSFAGASHVGEGISMHNRPPCSVTGRGVEIHIPKGKGNGAYRNIFAEPGRETYLLRVNCAQHIGPHYSPRIICLERLHCGHYTRFFSGDTEIEDDLTRPHEWGPIDYDETLYIHPAEKEKFCRDAEFTSRPNIRVCLI